MWVMFRAALLLIIILAKLLLFINCDPIWHSYQHDLFEKNREDFFITNLTSDGNFQLQIPVDRWKSLTTENICYAIGLMTNHQFVEISKIELNVDRNGFRHNSSTIELAVIPIDVALFEYWNKTERRTNIIAAIATDQQELIWLRVDQSDVIHLWSWPINKNISHINIFEIDHNYQILIISTYLTQTTADLYEFEPTKSHPNFWLRQTFPLDAPSKSSAINHHLADYYLSIPQKPFVLVYKLNNNHFIPYINITSSNVDEVVSFNIGSKSFLALNGLQANIHQFTGTNLTKSSLINTNLNGIEYWLPISIKNYRNEIVLLAQRNLHHGQHKSFVIEIITYNGRSFEEHDDIACNYFGEQTDNLLCLINEDDEHGIIGAISMSLESTLVGLLVPRRNSPAEMFLIDSVVRRNPSPVHDEIRQLLERKAHLEELIKEQEDQYKDLEARLDSSVKIDESNIINAPWTTVKTVVAPALHKSEPLILSIPDNEELLSPSTTKTSEQTYNIDSLKEKLSSFGREIAGMKATFDQIEENEGSTHFDTIIINGIVEVDGAMTIGKVDVKKIGGIVADELILDIVQREGVQKILGMKTFFDLDVDNLTTNQINDIESGNIAYQANPLVINGNVIVEETLQIQNNIDVISGEINDVNLEKEVIKLNDESTFVNNDASSLRFENIHVRNNLVIDMINRVPVDHESLIDVRIDNDLDVGSDMAFHSIYIPHNVTVKNINGHNFDELINQICFRNVRTYIPNATRIFGDIVVDENATTDYLNNLNFLRDYVFKSNNINPHIKGKKMFVNNLSTSELSCSGLINGIDTNQIITLSTDQRIPGETVADNLEIVEKLQVRGHVIGDYVNKFLPNPSLVDQNLIKSNIHFTDLIVDGVVVLSNNFTNVDFKSMLSSVVYKSEDNPIRIESMKDFPEGFTVRSDLVLKSNAINDVPLASFVRKDTEQSLAMNILNGIVNFGHLHITGLYNGINVKALDQELVKLTGEQYIESSLTFTDDIHVENLEIVDTLNGINWQDCFYTEGDRVIDDRIEFINNVNAANVYVAGNLSGILPDFDLVDFNRRRFSVNENQIIEGTITIKKSEIDDLQSDSINGISYDELVDHNKLVEKIIKNLTSGKLSITNFHVNGSVVIDDPKMKNKDNNFNESGIRNIEIKGNAFFDSIEIENLSGVNFGEFVDNLVFKNATKIDIFDTKTFTSGIEVEKLIETQLINNISIGNILTKQGAQTVAGPITVFGDVIFNDDIDLADNLNNYNINFFVNNFKVVQDQYRVKGEMVFSRLAYIENFYVDGFANEKSVQDHLNAIVYKNSSIKLTGTMSFENEVAFNGNLTTNNNINGLDLFETDSNIVRINEDCDISSSIDFIEAIIVEDQLEISRDMIADSVNGIDLENWKENAVNINRGFLKGHYIFEKAVIRNLTTNSINNINLTTIIPLRTKQTIDELTFGEIISFQDIPVGNKVNDYNLQKEYLNTLMNNFDQQINANLEFMGNIFVENLQLSGRLNGNDLNQIVTTNTDQNLTASYNFKSKVIVEDNIVVSELINGVNVTNWSTKIMKLFALYPQTIDDPLSIDGNLIFDGNVDGQGLINGYDLRELKSEIEEKRNLRYAIEKNLVDNYLNLCEDVTNLYGETQKQIYKFNYLEMLQYLEFPMPIQTVHHFEHQNVNYLIISLENNCFDHLLEFNLTHFHPVTDFKLGQITQIVTVHLEKLTFLVTINLPSRNNDCFGGTNIWKFEETTRSFLRIANIDDQELLQESIIPGTFYGLNQNIVTEFKITNNLRIGWKKYRKWIIPEAENVAFLPRGLSTGLGLRTGQKLIYLDREDPIIDDNYDGYDTENIIVGKISEEYNNFIPGRYDDDLTVLKVGSNRKTLLAVASHEETSVKSRLDFIKIFEDAIHGKLFHKVPTYKPSSLISLDFNNGETLLVFMEDQKTLQVYEYKGIEGFHHRISAKLEGSRLIPMRIWSNQINRSKKLVGLVNGNRLNIIEAVMLGNQIEDNLKCLL